MERAKSFCESLTGDVHEFLLARAFRFSAPLVELVWQYTDAKGRRVYSFPQPLARLGRVLRVLGSSSAYNTRYWDAQIFRNVGQYADTRDDEKLAFCLSVMASQALYPCKKAKFSNDSEQICDRCGIPVMVHKFHGKPLGFGGLYLEPKAYCEACWYDANHDDYRKPWKNYKMHRGVSLENYDGHRFNRSTYATESGMLFVVRHLRAFVPDICRELQSKVDLLP